MTFNNIIIVLALIGFTIGCKKSNEEKPLTGYIEAINYYVIAPESGYLENSALQEGIEVNANTRVANLDNKAQKIAIVQATRLVEQRQAEYQNLLSGQRPEELAVSEKALKAQQAIASEAERVLARQKALLNDKLTSQANLDHALAEYDAAKAKVEQLQQELISKQLPARTEHIAAAKAAVEQANEQLSLANWYLTRREVLASHDGIIEQVYFRQGEFVSQGQPIAAITSTSQVKVKFYLPQDQLSLVRAGQTVTITSDAGDNATASISLVAKEPSFMPPLLYGKHSRDKLVFLVEANIQGQTTLRQGQPVDVTL